MAQDGTAWPGMPLLFAFALLGAGGVSLGGSARERGDALLDEGRPAEALAVWQQALAQQPNSANLLIRIATAQARLGQLASAEATMQRAVRLEPRNPKVRHNLALVYLKQKELDKALAEFHEVLAIEDTYPTASYFIGLIHEMRGDEAAAEKYYVREVNNGSCLQAWDRLWRLSDQRRAEGKAPRGPDPHHVILFSVAVLVLAGLAYGLRLYLEARRGEKAREEL